MKKHVVLLTTLVLIALLAMAGTGMAQETGTTVSGKLTPTIAWSLSEGTLNIQGSGAAPNYEYPSSADPEPPWYEYRNEITHIVVGEGINSLGNYFFKNCENVVNVQLPSSLYTIGGAAFVGNSSLTQITIPDSVSSLSWDVFYNCTSLESVELPSSISSISSNVFYNTGDNLTIYGENNSYAQQYAKYNNIFFVAQKKEESITSQPMLTNKDKKVHSQENDNGSNNRDIVSDNKKPLSQPTTTGSVIEKNVYNENDWELRTLEDGTREVVKFLNTEATEAVIPEGVSSISEDAFNDCTALMSITVDDWMTTLDYGSILLIPIQEDRNAHKTTCAVVHCVSYGHYPQSADGTDNTPIQWIVLRKEDSKALLLSRYALDFEYYELPNVIHSNGLCWENSEIRRWLNNEFLHKAFSEEEQNHILKTNVDNSEEQGYYDWTLSYNPDTVDQVFLLSVAEVTYYAADQVIRFCEPTPYMDCDENIVSWWLRSPGPHKLYPAVVTQEGKIGNSSTLWAGPVRPAIWVDLACIDGLSQTMSPLELYRTIGEAKRNEGLWDEAIQAFYRADDYEQVNATYYAEGIQKFSEGDIEGALEAFRSADGYGDANLKISEILYQQAQSLIAEDQFEQAISILKTIGDYKDAQTLIQTRNSEIDGFVFEGTPNGQCCLKKYTGNLSEIIIPECDEYGQLVSYIGDQAFENCTSLISITIPDSVTSIGHGAFRDCSFVTNVTIPDSVTSIGQGAFNRCKSLANVTIPDSLADIEDYTFYNCRSLTSVTIPDSVTSIGEDAFSDCKSLTSISIPDSVTSIEKEAFSGCESLTSITIPDSVTDIGYCAFDGCTSLTSITIPDSVTGIGYGVFRKCSSLTSITIPDSVTLIGSDAFRNCWSLTSITLPDSVTSIGKNAFMYCSSLTSITLPNSVTSIGEYVFDGCKSLTSITVTPGSYAEQYCKDNNLPYTLLP